MCIDLVSDNISHVFLVAEFLFQFSFAPKLFCGYSLRSTNLDDVGGTDVKNRDSNM
jgi:hypothetical protein